MGQRGTFSMDDPTYENHELDGGVWRHKDSPLAVRRRLLDCIENRNLVRLWQGTNPSDPWKEEWGVLGRIGRSTGPMNVPLLVTPPPEGDGHGGGHLMDQFIIRIDECTPNWERGAEWKTTYQHPDFKMQDYTVDIVDKVLDGKRYRAEVFVDGKPQARFADPLAAYSYVLFMTGVTHERTYIDLEEDNDGE